MRLGDATTDVQTETCPAVASPARRLIERLEQARELVRRDAAPVIDHADDERIALAPHADLHVGPRRRMAQGIREEIVEGSTGFLCKPGDPAELAKAVETYFRSDLFKNLKVRRRELQDYARTNHSWDAFAELTRNAYAKILARNPL